MYHCGTECGPEFRMKSHIYHHYNEGEYVNIHVASVNNIDDESLFMQKETIHLVNRYHDTKVTAVIRPVQYISMWHPALIYYRNQCSLQILKS